jgi:hypothetical protein
VEEVRGNNGMNVRSGQERERETAKVFSTFLTSAGPES